VVGQLGFRSLAVAMSFALYSTCVWADAPRPVVTYPPDASDDPAFAVGEPITILWSGGDPKGSVFIDLIDVEANKAVSSVTVETANDGRLDWAFPSDLPCGRTYQFYIQDSQPKWSYGEPFTVACEDAP